MSLSGRIQEKKKRERKRQRIFVSGVLLRGMWDFETVNICRDGLGDSFHALLSLEMQLT